MDRYCELLSRSHLSVISAEPDRELDCIAEVIRGSVRVARRADLERWLERLVAASEHVASAPRTLDLLGHSAASGLLRLGDWLIDTRDPAVTAWFRGLAERGVLSSLGISAVRLLGCRTAATREGQSTICALADILGLEVYGTRHLLYGAHYDEHGFRGIWEFMLVGARALRPRREAAPRDRGPRTLDIAALPAVPLGSRAAGWPTRIATPNAVPRILRLVRCHAGARMPGSATPICALALPSAMPDAFHVADVVHGGAFLRFYPDGPEAPGVAYPVDEPRVLHRIIDELPVAVHR